MAHFAEIDSNNIVLRVIVVDDENCLDENGLESEQHGAVFCSQNFGGTWKQCSYNSNFRKNFPSVGFQYRTDLDAFIEPQPFSKWILNEETAQWEPPIANPSTDDEQYWWNDNVGQWELIVLGN